jgi:hypothetical protein
MFYLFMAAYELVRHCKDFDLLQFASGMSMIIGVFAGGVTIKSKSEHN